MRVTTRKLRYYSTSALVAYRYEPDPILLCWYSQSEFAEIYDQITDAMWSLSCHARAITAMLPISALCCLRLFEYDVDYLIYGWTDIFDYEPIIKKSWKLCLKVSYVNQLNYILSKYFNYYIFSCIENLYSVSTNYLNNHQN